MESSPLVPAADRDFNNAKQQYLEQFGSALVTNTYLKIALLCLSLVTVGLIALNVVTYQTYSGFKPLVIRINEVGRAEAVRYDSLQYKPQAPELKYFLIQFVRNHYSRVRATVKENYASSLYFLDRRLADSIMQAGRKSGDIEEFITGRGNEIEVDVKNVSIEDLRSPPYKATVDFEKVYRTPHDRREIRRELWVAHFVFIVSKQVPNHLVPINPLGLSITYFREDQAFQ